MTATRGIVPADLEAQHARLVRLFARLAAEVDTGEATTCDATWDAAARALDHHLTAEGLLLARLDEALPEHALALGALRDDHARLRHQLAVLGPLVQLHAASHGALQDLVTALQEHTTRAESSLYRWLEGLAPEEPKAPESAVLPGSALGASMGAIVGQIAGPVGILGGTVIGAALGAVAGQEIDRLDHATSGET